jgi:hypothetical protein
MRKPLLIGACLCAAASSAVGQGGYRLHSPEGAFTIELPRQPVYAKRPASGGVIIHQFALESGESAYVVAYFDLRANQIARVGAEGLLKSIGQGVARNRVVLAQRPIEVQTLPGNEITVQLRDGKVLRQRQLVHGHRVYMWNYVGLPSLQDSPEVLRYFESMTIGPAP